MPLGITAPFEEMSQRCRAVGNTVSNLTGQIFEPLTSRSRDKRVTVRSTGRRPADEVMGLASSLHASAYYREYNERFDLIIITCKNSKNK